MLQEKKYNKREALSKIKKNVCWSIIPARSGSTRILDKNIIKINGKELISYPIASSILSKKIRRTFVSTDSEKYKKIAIKYGAEVPFLRPKKISNKNSTDNSFIKHFIDFLLTNEAFLPEYLVLLRPTTPFRDTRDIDNAIDLFAKNSKYTSLRSSELDAHPPEKLYRILNKTYVDVNLNKLNLNDKSNLPGEKLPKTYKPNGIVDIIRTSRVIKSLDCFGTKILPFITKKTIDIDDHFDLEIAKLLKSNLKKKLINFLNK